MAADRSPDGAPPPPRLQLHQQALRLGRRIAIGIAGGVVVVAGAIMLVVPGPGLVTIALGLAILSLEFERPRVWLARMKARGVELKDRFREHRASRGKR